MTETEIVLADCVNEFIADQARTEYLGSQACLACEISDNNIESPPEQLWYAAASMCSQLIRESNVNPQYEIGKYRVDFMIDPIGYFINHPFRLFPDRLQYDLGKSLQKFVVEIDGFEWHDKTPEQAERDKTRERFIQQQGYKLFRYAAREVLRDPIKCVCEMEIEIQTEIRKACGQLTLQRTTHAAKYSDFEGLE